MAKYLVSERTACSLVRLSRAAYRYMPLPKDDEEPLRAEVIRMAGMIIGLLPRQILPHLVTVTVLSWKG